MQFKPSPKVGMNQGFSNGGARAGTAKGGYNSNNSN